MKTVLLYANEDKGLDSRLQAALDCARAFDAHLACVQVTPFDSFIMGDPFGGVYAVPTVLEQVRETETRHRERIAQHVVQRKRKPTRPSRAAKAKRVDEKKGRSAVKAGRGRVRLD